MDRETKPDIQRERDNKQGREASQQCMLVGDARHTVKLGGDQHGQSRPTLFTLPAPASTSWERQL